MNKTKIINSIQVTKDNEEYNNIMNIKRKLRQCTSKDMISIEYAYTKLIQLAYLSGIGQKSGIVLAQLKNACKLIIDSSINIDCWEYDIVKDWIIKGIC